MASNTLIVFAIVISSMLLAGQCGIIKRSFSDNSIVKYITERTCWWNEVCKEEFQQSFRCRCPQYSYCRSPGRYYNAYCSIANTGYIWTQPT
uniref:Putative conserved secreted protein n=1 Tax=Nyssomyia neivai TaxID=330878 RepID=A0A1L8DP62_9DIPT